MHGTSADTPIWYTAYRRDWCRQFASKTLSLPPIFYIERT